MHLPSPVEGVAEIFISNQEIAISICKNKNILIKFYQVNGFVPICRVELIDESLVFSFFNLPCAIA